MTSCRRQCVSKEDTGHTAWHVHILDQKLRSPLRVTQLQGSALFPQSPEQCHHLSPLKHPTAGSCQIQVPEEGFQARGPVFLPFPFFTFPLPSPSFFSHDTLLKPTETLGSPDSGKQKTCTEESWLVPTSQWVLRSAVRPCLG